MGQLVTDVGQLKKENRRELKKHAATIHCSNTLSLLQRKITNALLYHAYKELMLKDEHEITVKQLCRLIGYHGNNHAAIKEALKGLISTVIEWNLINDETGEENWTASSIIASVSLEGPLCYYAYSPRMKQLLHSPSMFGKIDLVIQSRFRSSYGLALYENCTRYRGLPYTKWFEIDLFKKLMGVPADKYDVFRDFKRRVLDKAIDEVNTYSDLIISPEFVKEGRKVVRIRFGLKEREKKKRLGAGQAAGQLPNQELKETLKAAFGLSGEQIRRLLETYETDYTAEKARLIMASRSYQEGRIENLSAYLLSALKHDYQQGQPPSQMVDMQNAREEIELGSLKRVAEEIRAGYRAYREKAIHETIALLEPDEKAQFMDAFIQHAEPVIATVLQVQRHAYTRETILDSPQLQAQLRQYAIRELDMLSLIPLEEYVADLDERQKEAWQKLKSLDPDDPVLRFAD